MEEKKNIQQKIIGSNSIENITLLIDECNKECDKRKTMNLEIKQNKNLLMTSGYVIYDDCNNLKCDECPIEKRRKSLQSDRARLVGWGVGL